MTAPASHSDGDITALRAELKRWERQFRSAHRRDPAKADIQAEPEIAAKYKAYSRARHPPKPKKADDGPQTPGRGGGGVKRSVSTASLRPPLPPSRPPAPAPGPSATTTGTDSVFKTPSKPTPSSAAARKLNNVMHGSPPPPQPSFRTPTKRRTSTSSNADPYDNPFVEQPGPSNLFHFASSPQKLRTLVAAHSVSRSPNTSAAAAVGWTPRTRARKRLRGEDVPPTPGRARKSRGALAGVGPEKSADVEVFLQAKEQEMEVDEEEEEEPEEDGEEEDVLAPTPAKNGVVFRPIFDDNDEDEDEADGNGPPTPSSRDKGKAPARPILPARRSTTTLSAINSAATTSATSSTRSTHLFRPLPSKPTLPPPQPDPQPSTSALPPPPKRGTKRLLGPRESADFSAAPAPSPAPEQQPQPDPKRARRAPAQSKVRFPSATEMRAPEQPEEQALELEAGGEGREGEKRKVVVHVVPHLSALARRRRLKSPPAPPPDPETFDPDTLIGAESSSDEDDLPLLRPSPTKARWNGAREEEEPADTLAAETAGVPTGLLSILSLTSPAQRARQEARERDRRVASIFAPRPFARTLSTASASSLSPSRKPAPAPQPPRKQGKGPAPPPPPREEDEREREPDVEDAFEVARRAWRVEEVLGSEGEGEEGGGADEDGEDDDWASEVEGWKEDGVGWMDDDGWGVEEVGW